MLEYKKISAFSFFWFDFSIQTFSLKLDMKLYHEKSGTNNHLTLNFVICIPFRIVLHRIPSFTLFYTGNFPMILGFLVKNNKLVIKHRSELNRKNKLFYLLDFTADRLNSWFDRKNKIRPYSFVLSKYQTK